MPVAETNRTKSKLQELTTLLQKHASMLIVLQDNPDPDALGAAVALRKLANVAAGMQCSFGAGGTVGRAENRALVNYLQLNIRPLAQLSSDRFDVVAMVDTQPGQGNNSLPEDFHVSIVIDHHPLRPETRTVEFRDVRSRYGATSTVLCEYLMEAEMDIDVEIATALLYGIRSDTQDFGREATQADIQAYGILYPLANKRLLGTIQRGQVPTAYFQMLAAGLENARLCGRCAYSDLGVIDNPDMIAEVADLLLRHEEADWALTWGYCDGVTLLSLRTESPSQEADAAIKRVVRGKGSGGGHHTMAGGQIPLMKSTATHRRELGRLIRDRFLKAAGQQACSCRRLL